MTDVQDLKVARALGRYEERFAAAVLAKDDRDRAADAHVAASAALAEAKADVAGLALAGGINPPARLFRLDGTVYRVARVNGEPVVERVPVTELGG